MRGLDEYRFLVVDEISNRTDTNYPGRCAVARRVIFKTIYRYVTITVLPAGHRKEELRSSNETCLVWSSFVESENAPYFILLSPPRRSPTKDEDERLLFPLVFLDT
jgi:hypothetical protein